MTDDDAMALALEEALIAEKNGDVPIGAVVVHNETVISRAHNEREMRNDPTAHAEIIALQQAAEIIGSWMLTDCTLVVTLEPCVMCAGALVNARIIRLVYGAKDPKGGAVDSLYKIPTNERLNHRVEVKSGVKEQECSSLLTEFFLQRRGV